ncbi:hypothetical protein EN828_16165 [Mesorhizobium sp. M2D.F.Ca.ET.185.01.1.1]|uniref:hypothetical protein n=2 Tax=Mesorhizobium TaxID=68287 RepID=UPI000FCB6C7B|nr:MULTISPECIES: hypothetical protein [unclassified Mesorhizobium]TGP54892.1 hypothetical protein EN873_05570 [bacterium M00.F.Ca.ET.230.01.1.1]TGP80467.1 hypothetical protein EN870_12485 [bacterium M00.F.Ca.ET.227.01.1.1]TGQ00564.1 hypothetical protein EN864_00855 [bacterium M00.F.Ca.ET.221.01.1.1]TGQ02914.1 hypothetical protein EN865_03050 [bacterium M00.F.Ca.ET.222.01.1.1]TGT74405.1 hypothetical protein EN802_11175 [bacterium M00.F.Ca.ET.159.01.1.1]TGT86655.1 hypothetical protein EN800_080
MTNSRIIAPMVALLLILSFFVGSIVGPHAVGMQTAGLILLAPYCVPGLVIFAYVVRRFNFIYAAVANAAVSMIIYLLYWNILYDDFQFSYPSMPFFVLYFFVISVILFSILQLVFFRNSRNIMG